MLNEIVPVVLPRGGLASVVLPAFSAGYCVYEITEGENKGSLQMYVVLKLATDPSYHYALNVARKQAMSSKGKVQVTDWVSVSSQSNGGGPEGAPNRYWGAVLSESSDGVVSLKTMKGDPIADAYRSVSDRSAVSSPGYAELARIMDSLEDDGPGSLGFSSE